MASALAVTGSLLTGSPLLTGRPLLTGHPTDDQESTWKRPIHSMAPLPSGERLEKSYTVCQLRGLWHSHAEVKGH